MSVPIVVAGLAALGCLPWFLGLLLNVLMARKVRRFRDLSPREPARWPRLSVVVPACNEAATLERAAATLLQQDYPDLQLVLVDDRSSDDTGAIVDRLAASDARVRPLHITELPDGWLGKVHALHRGLEAADGELVLFTDADVRFSPTALRRAVAYAEERALDHLCLIPDLSSRSFVVNLCIATALRAIAASQKPWRVEDPARKEAIGSGAFNLVRRKAFVATEGFEWLRLEVADDLGVGHLMKRAGARVGLAAASDDVTVPWYETLGQVFRGMEKNAFAQIARYSVVRGLVLSALFVFVALSPFVTLLPLGVPGLWLVGAGALLANVGNAWLFRSFSGFSPLPTLLSAPFGDLLLAAMVVRGTLLGALRGGLLWRDTVYPTALLKTGMRVDF